MKIQNYRVAATITAYEDPKSVEHCLQAIEKQSFKVDSILIFENSQKSPFVLEDQKENNENITIHRSLKNIGTAGALEFQVSWAIKHKFDFLWLFDQDSEPTENCLEKLINCYQILHNSGVDVGITAPVPIEPKTRYLLHGLDYKGHKFVPAPTPSQSKSFYTCDAVIASGSLINIKAAELVNTPEIDLFIDAVDWAYCLSLRKKNFEIAVVTNALMLHKYASCMTGKFPFSNRTFLIHNYSPLRRYYICRNHTYILKKHASRLLMPKIFLNRIGYLIKTTLKILIYESNEKDKKLKACFLGTIDGFTGTLGRRWG